MTTTQSTAAEVIPWKTMTPEQRNALIAEKVMGLRVEHWTDKELRCKNEDGEEEVWSLRTGYVVIDGRSNPGVPRYSESMDTAWSIVEKLYDGCNIRLYMEEDNRDRHFAQIWHRDRDKVAGYGSVNTSMAEAICVAALRTMGYVVLQ